MLAADADFQVGVRAAPELHAHLHETSHTFLVKDGERVCLQDALMDIFRQELPCVVTGITEGHLGQVIRTEGEELCHLGDLVSGEGCTRDFNHRANHVFHLHAFFFKYLLCHPADDACLLLQLLHCANEGNHDFRTGVKPAEFQVAGSFDDGARLHFRDFRIGDAQAAAAVSEHRVELVEGVHFLLDALNRHAELLGHVLL